MALPETTSTVPILGMDLRKLTLLVLGVGFFLTIGIPCYYVGCDAFIIFVTILAYLPISAFCVWLRGGEWESNKILYVMTVVIVAFGLSFMISEAMDVVSNYGTKPGLGFIVAPLLQMFMFLVLMLSLK